MEMQLKNYKSFLNTARMIKRLSLKISFLHSDDYHKATSDLNTLSSIVFDIKDKDTMKRILPNPYDKKAIVNQIECITIDFGYGKRSFDDVLVFVKVKDTLPNDKSISYQRFKDTMEAHRKATNIMTEFLSQDENRKFYGVLASKNGMQNAYSEIINVVAEHINEETDISDAIESNTITDDSLSDDDYYTLLYGSMIEAEEDIKLIKKLFDQQLNFQYIDVSTPILKDLAHNTKLRYSISDIKIKTIIGYALMYKINDESIISLLNSSIPDRYIISKQTPHLNLNPVLI